MSGKAPGDDEMALILGSGCSHRVEDVFPISDWNQVQVDGHQIRTPELERPNCCEMKRVMEWRKKLNDKKFVAFCMIAHPRLGGGAVAQAIAHNDDLLKAVCERL